MNEHLICFESVTSAIMAEQALLGAGIAVRVMPVPAGIRTGCGFCLRVAPGDAARVADHLAKLDVGRAEMWIRTAEGSYYMEETHGRR